MQKTSLLFSCVLSAYATTALADVTGSVKLEGKAPAETDIKMDQDPKCKEMHAKGAKTDDYAVNGGKVADVFVYVKNAPAGKADGAAAPAVCLDQKGCMYSPKVFGILANQKLDIINSDPTLHNIHALPKSNSEFNTGQPIQGMKTTHTFTQKEVMVPFKCDVHGWMNAYVGVLDHPYFAVTGDDGKFDLKDLPPGTYTIEAWHEKLGTMTESVTIGPKEAKEVAFTFKAAAAASN
jgi:hypothetical protein